MVAQRPQGTYAARLRLMITRWMLVGIIFGSHPRSRAGQTGVVIIRGTPSRYVTELVRTPAPRSYSRLPGLTIEGVDQYYDS